MHAGAAMKHIHTLLLLPVALIASAQAATTLGGVTLGPLALGGNTDFAIWDSMNAQGLTGTGGFPGTTMWATQNAQAGSTAGTQSKLVKVSNGVGGGAFGSGGSMYYGGFSGDQNVPGGTVAVSTTVPLANLESVVFQIQIGEAATWDFYNNALPVLNYTVSGDTTVYSMTATASSLYHQHNNGTVEMPTGTETIWVNSYAIWFDVGSIEETLSSFNVSWVAVQHAQVYGVSLQQSDAAGSASLLPTAVPEPSAALLGGVGVMFLFRRRRK